MLSEHDTNPTQSPPAEPSSLAPPTPEPEPPTPVHPDVLLKAGAALGVVMLAAAFAWVNLARQENLLDALRPDTAWQLGPGLAAGAAFAWGVWVLGRRLQAIRSIVRLLEEMLDLNAITFRHVLLFSLLAAVPEELLFRGAVQASLGLVAAAVIFGALHALTRFYFVYATIAGLFLGGLALLSGQLWLPIGAHFAIDFITFMLLLQRQQHYVN
ncbi:MAG: CPBP family intramembrane metalloprotease [Anaerolineae bacterium]|nr:CPBP family intramembrane metalloprotease [Anaerolineae bacterium]